MRRTVLGTATLVAAVALVLMAGCASNPPHGPDPWERMNRGTFAFNEAADRWVVEPAAKGWDYVVPEVVQDGISNFFENLRMPIFVINNLLQGEIEDGAIELSRFAINTTWGLLGFIDVATRWDYPHEPEDFGLTLGHWGLDHGPYLVLPVLGPSSVRDTVGLGVDAGLSAYWYFVPAYVPVSARATDLLNLRAIFLEEVAQNRQEAFDFYVFVGRGLRLPATPSSRLCLPSGA